MNPPGLQGLPRLQRLALEDHLERAPRAEQMREPLRSAGSGVEPERHLREPDHAGVARHVAQVARQRELAAAVEGRAVDRGDEHLVEPADAQEQVVDRVQLDEACRGRSPERVLRARNPRGAAHGSQRGPRDPARHLHSHGLGSGDDLLDVVVGDEAPLDAARDHDRADRRVTFERAGELVELGDHDPVHEVVRGVLDLDGHRAAVAIGCDRGHCALLSSRATCSSRTPSQRPPHRRSGGEPRRSRADRRGPRRSPGSRPGGL
jgi:hypothetical protein